MRGICYRTIQHKQRLMRALGDVLARHPGNRTSSNCITSGLAHTLSARQTPRDPEQWLCNFRAHLPPCLPPCQACTESFYATQTMEVKGTLQKKVPTYSSRMIHSFLLLLSSHGELVLIYLYSPAHQLVNTQDIPH